MCVYIYIYTYIYTHAYMHILFNITITLTIANDLHSCYYITVSLSWSLLIAVICLSQLGSGLTCVYSIIVIVVMCVLLLSLLAVVEVAAGPCGPGGTRGFGQSVRWGEGASRDKTLAAIALPGATEDGTVAVAALVEDTRQQIAAATTHAAWVHQLLQRPTQRTTNPRRCIRFLHFH